MRLKVNICQYSGRQNGKQCRKPAEYVFCEEHYRELVELYIKLTKEQKQ